MTVKAAKAPKRETLNVRIKQDDRKLIDRAARLLGKTRTDFLLAAGRKAAEDALLDQTLIHASGKAYAEFLNRLDASPTPNDKLRKTMATKSPWEK